MKNPCAYLFAMFLATAAQWTSPAMAETSSGGGTGNYTPGNSVGNDHSAYLFSPFYWQIAHDDDNEFNGPNNGEHEYLKYACSGGGKGQQYEGFTYVDKGHLG